MVHQYKNNGYDIVLDVNSGAIHVVDDVTYDVIEMYAARENVADTSAEEIVTALSGKYGKEEVEEAIDEVQTLIKNEELFTKDTYENYMMDFKKRPTVVKALCLHIAHDCNLACRYCFAEEGEYHGRRALMTFEVGKKALDFLIANSGNRRNLEVDFFGGEPLMNFDVVKKTVEYGREQEKKYGKVIRFTITTNGVLVNDEIMDFFNKEMSNVVLSIDGRPEVHNSMRKTVNGKNSFDTVAKNSLKIALSRGQRQYYVRGTFTAHNLDFTNDVRFLSDYGFKQLSMEPVVAEKEKDYALLPEHMEAIEQEYEKLARLYLERLGTDKEFGFFHFMLDLTGGPCLPKRITGCGAGSEYVAVTPTGDIYPCHQFVGLEECRMGSVMDGSFDTQAQARYKACNVLTKPDCRECWAKYYCSGGCLANAFIYNGDLYKPFKMGCLTERKRLECALAIMAIRAEEGK